MAERKKRTARPKSDARIHAEELVKSAAGEQEKRVAVQTLKNVKFRELIVPRVNVALNALEKLGAAAKPTAYHWTDDEAQAIADALVSGTNDAIRKLFDKEQVKKAKFSL